MIFAKNIIDDKKLCEKLYNKEFVNILTFGVFQITIVENIADKKDYKSVNIENWCILIYFYYVMKLIEWELPKNNLFIKAIETGTNKFTKTIKFNEELYTYVFSNGLYNYYRLLMAMIIFNNGKAVYGYLKCDCINELNIESIKKYLKKFKTIASLNYDLIIESLGINNIIHMHGKYICSKEIYARHQSLKLKYENTDYELSDIIIGDYITSKTIFENILRDNKYSRPLFDSVIKDKEINNVVIFGMNIENDYHVLRESILGLYDRNVWNPNIIYCYFKNAEKEEFERIYPLLLTFGKDVNEYAENIKISFIDTNDILNKYFRSAF